METSAFAPASADAGAGPSSSAPASAPFPGSSVENIQIPRAPNEIPPRTSSQYRVMDRAPKSFPKAPHETDWIAQKRRPKTAAPALESQSANEEKPSTHMKHSSLPLTNISAAKQQQQQQHEHRRTQHNNRHYNHEPNHHHNSSNHDFYLLKNKGIGSQINGSGYQSDTDYDRYQRHQRRQHQHHHNHHPHHHQQQRQQQQADELYDSERWHPELHQSDLSPPPKEPFREIAAEQIYRQNPEWIREKDKVVLAPYEYLLVHPGKDIRSRSIVAFNAFLRVPDESLKVIKRVVGMLHTASLLIDDVEDSSVLRRGVPVAHSIFGIPQTINSANYVYFLALKELSLLQNVSEAIGIYTDELVNLHRGQGMDLFWRDTLTCPSEADYLEMVGNKTGGLFRLAVKLMQVESATDIDCVPLVNTIGLLFQIHDDYQNLHPSSAQSLSKGTTCEDLTEGKFSFPVIHAIRADPASHLLQNILRQRTADPDVKRYAVDYLERVGSFAYTRRVLRDLSKRAMVLIDELEGKVEGLLPSGTEAAAAAAPGMGSTEMIPPSEKFTSGDTNRKRYALEETTALQSSANNINMSSSFSFSPSPPPLPLEAESNKPHNINPINNNNNNSSSSNRRNKHVKIGHGVRQILEKLKVDTPRPNSTANTNTNTNTNTNNTMPATATVAGTGIGDSTAAALATTTSPSAANGLEPGTSEDPPQPQPEAAAAPEEEESTAQVQVQMPLASSPSTPMAMTELPPPLTR